MSQEDYIENLASCQLKIKKLQWSYSLWPKENKAPKPSFESRYDKHLIYDLILSNLKEESQLQDEFSFELSHSMLQGELNRMVQNSKNPSRLKQVFQLLNYDANTIVECVVRSHLINKYYRLKTENKNILIEPKQLQNINNNFILNENTEVDYSLPEISSKIKNFLLEADSWTTINSADAPAARYFHTAVWTGSKMIVWGGRTGTGIKFKSGGIYDPTFDTWSATREDTAPSARIGHTAIWNGIWMIVWGGNDGNNLNSGSRYDPVADSWIVTSPSNINFRQQHTVVWTGTHMIVWGGFNAGNLNDGGIYDFSSNTWTDTSITGLVPSPAYYP